MNVYVLVRHLLCDGNSRSSVVAVYASQAFAKRDAMLLTRKEQGAIRRARRERGYEVQETYEYEVVEKEVVE